MSLSQHAILHRRVKKRIRGQLIDKKPELNVVPHVYVAADYADRIDRSVTGTTRTSRFKILIWGEKILTLQDWIELDGNPNEPGTGILYEIVEIDKDYRRLGRHVSYIIRRKQDQNNK